MYISSYCWRKALTEIINFIMDGLKDIILKTNLLIATIRTFVII